MARPKTPVEQRLAEDWQQLYEELLPRLERMKKLQEALFAMEISPPHPKPNQLLKILAELARPTRPK